MSDYSIEITTDNITAAIAVLRELEKRERTASLNLIKDVEATAHALVSAMRAGNTGTPGAALARIGDLLERWSRLDPDGIMRALDRAVSMCEPEVER